MKRTWLFSSVVLFCGTMCCQTTCAQETDPVEVIWEEFLNDPGQLVEIDEWVEKILLVIDQNPASPVNGNVLRNLAGSCNSTEKYDKSIELMLKALTLDDSVYWRLVTIGHLGAVHEIQYEKFVERGDRETARNHAESVLEYYARFTEELTLESAKHLEDWQKFNLQQRLIFFRQTEASLLRDVKGDTSASLKKHDEALALLASNPKLTESGLLQGMGLDTAFFQREKAATLLQKGSLQEAIAGMIAFGKTPSTSKEVKSFTARKFAEAAFLKRGKDYRDFLNRWFHEVPHDKETVVILLEIGKSYFDEGSYTEAIEVFENIRTSWWQQALDLDPIALREQRGGYFTEVLRLLCMSYQETGQLDKAALCLDELKKLVPKDVWVSTLERHQEHAVDEHERVEFLRKLEAGEFKPRRPWGLIIGGNLVLIALLIYLLMRKTKAGA